MKKLNRKTTNAESLEAVTHTNALKEKRGITLVALVVTIVVLLILAGVSLNAIFSENGIINRAKDAQNKMNGATLRIFPYLKYGKYQKKPIK